MPIDRKYIDTLIGQRVTVEYRHGGRVTGVVTSGGDDVHFSLNTSSKDLPGYTISFRDVESVTRVHDGHTINIGPVTMGEPPTTREQRTTDQVQVVDTRHWSRHPLEGQLTPERRQVYTWLQAEEKDHQDLKFTEVTKTDGGDLSDDAWTYRPLMERWHDQISMYLHRADLLGLTSPLGRQAAAKAVATAHGMLESIVRVYGDLPPGGVPSGEIDGYVDPMGEEADRG